MNIAEEKFYWNCGQCGIKNSILAIELAKNKSNEDLILICGKCGLAHELLQTLDDSSWLNCIPFEGVERVLPTGFVSTPGKETLWNDGRGNNLLSKPEYIKAYGIDPEVYWKNTHGKK